MDDDILGLGRKPGGSETSRRIKDWVRMHWEVDDATPVMVSELTCHEAGCPDVETVISVMVGGGDTVTVKLKQPMAGLTAADIAAASPRRRSAVASDPPRL